MLRINLHNRVFKPLINAENGEVSNLTRFHYKQDNDMIWADYEGGEIVKGQIIGKFITSEIFEFVYQHLNKEQDLMTGKCTSTISFNKQGKLLLNESWHWSCRDFSKGTSILIEV